MSVTTAAAASVEYREQSVPPDVCHGIVAKRTEATGQISVGAAAGNACVCQPAGAGPRAAAAARPAPPSGDHKDQDDDGALKAGAAMLGLWPKDSGNHTGHVVTGQIVRNVRHEPVAAAHAPEGGSHHAFSYGRHANVWHAPSTVARTTTDAPPHRASTGNSKDNTRHKPVAGARLAAKIPPHSDGSRRSLATAAAHPVPHHRLIVETKPMQPKVLPNSPRRELPPILS
ncbi:hypothetical protein AB4Y36_24775 [Paraburkholderia sp. BR10936]|uniref:hypothetical protein n=1 Tax=Paraburkholderia sp. BR10936 TaxID=3236993 RepID=UPI0034D2D724